MLSLPRQQEVVKAADVLHWFSHSAGEASLEQLFRRWWRVGIDGVTQLSESSYTMCSILERKNIQDLAK